MRLLKNIGIVAIALALFAIPVHAEDEGDEYEGVPAYTVTRLKIYEGSAWVRTPDSGDWEEFTTNSPVPSRSLISIPEGSEAELQFHGGQFVLLTAGTELSLLDLRDDRTSFRIRGGEIRFYLPEPDFAPVHVTVPGGGKLDFSVPGRYWINASDGDETTLVVRKGEGTVSTERGEFRVQEGEQASIARDVRISRLSGEDRDSYEEPPPLSDTEKQVNVPPAAAYELREYGEWVYSSEYGYVWRPRVSSGWSPYYYGRWSWVSPYGWTWISYEPWGWYPYHYGYWYIDSVFGWVWYPYRSFLSVSFAFGHHHYPHYHHRVFYRPANVRFVRDGHRVRWVPLRPGERSRRVAFTRSDSRLASWERRLERGTVYVRRDGVKDREWRDWTDVRRDRREAARTRNATIRREEGRKTRDVPVVSPGPGERAIDRSTRGRGERPGEEIRGSGRPGRDVPARPQRMERETPQPARRDRRSETRTKGSEGPSPREKYGNRSRERIPFSVRVPPARSGISDRGKSVSPTRWKGDSRGRDSGKVIRPGAGPVVEDARGRPPRIRSFSVERGDGNRSRGGGVERRGGADFNYGGGRGGR